MCIDSLYLCFADSTVAETWQFTSEPVTTEVDSETLFIRWQPIQPMPNTDPESTDRFHIYLLLWHSTDRPEWRKVTMTSETTAKVNGQHSSFAGLEFQLHAISPAGAVAVAFPAYPPTGMLLCHPGLIIP